MSGRCATHLLFKLELGRSDSLRDSSLPSVLHPHLQALPLLTVAEVSVRPGFGLTEIPSALMRSAKRQISCSDFICTVKAEI